MRSTAFRGSVPLALVVCISAFAFSETPADEKRPPRRQAAEMLVGGARKRVAEVLNAASNRAPAETPAPATAPPPGATATKVDSSTAAKADSSKRAEKATPAKEQKSPRGSKADAERDSSAKKATAGKDDHQKEHQDEPVRGPRLPVWPGITMTNPSAGNVEMLAAAY